MGRGRSEPRPGAHTLTRARGSPSARPVTPSGRQPATFAEPGAITEPGAVTEPRAPSPGEPATFAGADCALTAHRARATRGRRVEGWRSEHLGWEREDEPWRLG